MAELESKWMVETFPDNHVVVRTRDLREPQVAVADHSYGFSVERLSNGVM